MHTYIHTCTHIHTYVHTYITVAAMVKIREKKFQAPEEKQGNREQAGPECLEEGQQVNS